MSRSAVRLSHALRTLPTLPLNETNFGLPGPDMALTAQEVSPKRPASEATEAPSPSSVAAYVRKEAITYGVDPADAVWIVSHESQFGQRVRGDDDQICGYWMISDIWHPEVSTACADDLQRSTA